MLAWVCVLASVLYNASIICYSNYWFNQFILLRLCKNNVKCSWGGILLQCYKDIIFIMKSRVFIADMGIYTKQTHMNPWMRPWQQISNQHCMYPNQTVTDLTPTATNLNLTAMDLNPTTSAVSSSWPWLSNAAYIAPVVIQSIFETVDWCGIHDSLWNTLSC